MKGNPPKKIYKTKKFPTEMSSRVQQDSRMMSNMKS